MKQFLLDTNICIAYFKADGQVLTNLRKNEGMPLFISEITLAELKYGAVKSARPQFHADMISKLLKTVDLLPITPVLDQFSLDKTRLSQQGTIIPDFDLLIGATAIHHDLTLVTNNTKHFQRLEGIKLEDWTK